MKKKKIRGFGVGDFRGKGVVKIVRSIEDFGLVCDGDIVVAKNATPDFVLILEKTKCLITDEGGVTSHIAIVCRELGKAAIVGTGTATKILKNELIVKYDTSNGSVNIVTK